MIRLLTVGGTPFDAMQRYAPEECRFACRNINVDPLIVKTICPEKKEKKIENENHWNSNIQKSSYKMEKFINKMIDKYCDYFLQTEQNFEQNQL